MSPPLRPPAALSPQFYGLVTLVYRPLHRLGTARLAQAPVCTELNCPTPGASDRRVCLVSSPPVDPARTIAASPHLLQWQTPTLPKTRYVAVQKASNVESSSSLLCRFSVSCPHNGASLTVAVFLARELHCRNHTPTRQRCAGGRDNDTTGRRRRPQGPRLPARRGRRAKPGPDQ